MPGQSRASRLRRQPGQKRRGLVAPPRVGQHHALVDDRFVQLTFLLFHLSGPDDPMIDAARRSGDQMLGADADVMQTMLHDLMEQQAGGAPGSGG